MNKLWMVPVALVAPLIIAGCGGPKVDQRSYDAGYHSAGPSLVAQGVFATAACEQALEAAYLFVSKDFQNYDTQSFNTGCYTAIHDSGDPVKDANGDPVPGLLMTDCPGTVRRHADFIECGCDHLSVSYVDHNSHLEDVWRASRDKEDPSWPS